MTAVRLQTGPTLLSVAFGAPAQLRERSGVNVAIFDPGKIVAYLARHPPAQALYLFRTAPTNSGVGVRLRYVSEPVDLFYVAYTRRTIRKATMALDAIAARSGATGVDVLPDLFWFQLADFLTRREWRIVCYVRRMLAGYQSVS